MITFLNTLEKSFIAIGRAYQDSVASIEKLQAFDYKKESEVFFKLIGSDFVFLVELFSRVKIEEQFFDEIKHYSSDESYLKRLNVIMTRQYNFLKSFQKVINEFYYDSEEFDYKLKLQLSTFESINCEVNLSTLLTREKSEIDEIYESMKEDFNIPYHILQEQISEHDIQMFQEQGVIPQRETNNDKLGKQNFIYAIQVTYIWIFKKIEERLNLYIADYEIKLGNQEDETNQRVFVRLKTNLNHLRFKTKLYNFLKSGYVDCEFDEFENIFYDSIHKISWKGTLVDLVLIFKGSENHSFVDPNYNILRTLVSCFLNKDKELNYDSLKSNHARSVKNLEITKYQKIYNFLKSC